MRERAGLDFGVLDHQRRAGLAIQAALACW